jgi:hypothetical protein
VNSSRSATNRERSGRDANSLERRDHHDGPITESHPTPRMLL